MNLVLTNHARQRIAERSIDPQHMGQALALINDSVQSRTSGDWMAQASLTDGRTMVVVWAHHFDGSGRIAIKTAWYA